MSLIHEILGRVHYERSRPACGVRRCTPLCHSLSYALSEYRGRCFVYYER